MKSLVERKKTTINHRWAIVIGIGLALSPIHNVWFTELVTKDGVVGFFLPAFGFAIWITATLYFVFVYDNWRNVNSRGKAIFSWSDLKLGDRTIYIPLLVIVLSMGISGILNGATLKDKFAPLLMGISLFAVYIASRSLGPSIFRALIPFVIIGTIVAVVSGLFNPGVPTGGLITNYCASAGFLIFGGVVNQGKWQWALLTLMLVGLFFIGALEAVFIVGVMGIVVIIRRDFSRRFIIVVGSMMLLVGIWTALGYLTPLYEGNHNLSVLYGLISGTTTPTQDTLNAVTTGRWESIVNAIQNIRLFGHGYSLSTVGGGIVHNIPLIIMHQIGPVAAIAWSIVTVYCLIKTKWKYAWIAVIAMCVWDHYLWTQFAPYFLVLVGVSTAPNNIVSDLIFRRSNKVEDTIK